MKFSAIRRIQSTTEIEFHHKLKTIFTKPWFQVGALIESIDSGLIQNRTFI